MTSSHETKRGHPEGSIHLSSIGIRQRLDEYTPVFLEFGDIIPQLRDNRFVVSLDLSARLRLVSRGSHVSH